MAESAQPLSITPPPRGASGAGAVALLALGFTPVATAYGLQLWGAPWDRGYLLALPGAILLAWLALRREASVVTPSAAALWRGLLGVSLGLLAVAVLRWSPGVGVMGAGFALAGTLGAAGGWSLLRRLAPAFFVLAIGLEPLAPWDATLQERLQAFVLTVADQMLYSLEVPHFLRGNGFEMTALTVPKADLFTGLAGLPGLVLVTLVTLVALRRHPVRILLATLAVWLYAVPAEALRIAWGVQACDRIGGNFFLSNRASLLTAGLWFTCLVLVFSLDQFVAFLVAPNRRTTEPVVEPPEPPSRVSWRAAIGLGRQSSRLDWIIAGVAALLGLAGLGRGWLQFDSLRQTATVVSALPTTAVFTPPVPGTGWLPVPAAAVIAPVVTAGRDAHSWQWQNGQVTISLGLDGPLSGYADPTPSYAQRGWDVERTSSLVATTNAAPPCVEVELRREPMLHGWLWYGVLDETGRWLEPPAHQPGWTESAGASSPGKTPTHRVQALAVGARPLTPEEREGARQLFEAARVALAGQLKQQAQSK